ncbi:MAG: alanine racemase [Candidatus Baltobacteraceae bacterium]
MISLDGKIVAANFSAWTAYASVPVRPVIKCNAYNWGYKRIIDVLDPLCKEYCVADIEELAAARALTKHPIVVLGAIPAGRLAEALDAGGIPTINTREELAAAVAWLERTGRRPRIRVGLQPAIGWTGMSLAQIEELAPHLAASGFAIEVWTHITDMNEAGRLRDRLAQAAHTLRCHGANVVAKELASTYPLAAGGAMGDTARVGIGLFGSTGGSRIEGVRCALRLSAPVVAVIPVKAGTKVGYGQRKIGQDGRVLTLRCGYGDGLPKSLANTSDILSVGMQYTTIVPPHEPFGEQAVALLDEATDLDAFAAAGGVSPHELVTALGNAQSRTHVVT